MTRPAPTRALGLLAPLSLSLSLAGCGAPAPDTATAAPAPVGASAAPLSLAPYAAAGPYAVQREQGGPGNAFVLYTPQRLGERGELHPILTWGNGTFAIPYYYEGILSHLASHGFVVIASRSSMTGTGREMLQGVDWLVAQSVAPGSRYYGKLDALAIGVLGHSQGGGGTINAANDPRVRALAPIEPAPARIAGVRAPMLLLGGSRDNIVSPTLLIRPFSYVPATAPTVYGVLQGADHLTALGDAGGFRPYLTAWFKHHLMGDMAAGPLFYGDACGLCTDANWTVERKNL